MKKNLLSLIGAGSTVLSGCMVPQYATNAGSSMRSDTFSDRDFNSGRPEVSLPIGNYTFGPIPEGYDVFTADDNQPLSKAQILPVWALRTNEMSERVLPTSQRYQIERADGKVRLFVLESNSGHAYLQTNHKFTPSKLPEGQIAGMVPESKFSVPRLDFGLPGMREVPYGIERNDRTGEDGVVLVSLPSYRLNHQTGGIEIMGDIFKERIGYLVMRVKPIANLTNEEGETINPINETLKVRTINEPIPLPYH